VAGNSRAEQPPVERASDPEAAPPPIRPARTTGKGGAAIPFKLTGRDLEILRAVHRYRYLRTGQVWRLLFPETRTLQSARRRLRRLTSGRYLVRIGRAGQAGEGFPESAFALGEAGSALLSSLGDELISYPRTRAGGGHVFLEHALAISEFRMALELALPAVTGIRLHRFVHEDELKTHLRQGISKDAYKLYNHLIHPRTGREYVVHPDALFILATGEAPEVRRLYFLEIDRGTETLGRIRDKAIGYHLLKGSGVFRKFGDFSDFLVLLVTNAERRALRIREALTDSAGEADIWVAAAAGINATTVLTGAVWLDSEGAWQAVLRG
jgi:hypothetical protein